MSSWSQRSRMMQLQISGRLRSALWCLMLRKLHGHACCCDITLYDCARLAHRSAEEPFWRSP